MGGRHSRQCGPPADESVPTFILLQWDAPFLGARMAAGVDGAAASSTSSSAPSAPPPPPPGLASTPSSLAQAILPVVDARRLISLVEGTPQHPPRRVVRGGRLVVSPADFTLLNSRLWGIFRRRGYHPAIGPREVQGLAAAHALQRFQRRLSRERRQRQRRHQQGGWAGPSVVVVVAGDGGLEASGAYAAALRTVLRNGHILEVWSWEGHVPSLYPQLAAEPGSEGRVRIVTLDGQREAIRYGGSGGVVGGIVTSALESIASIKAATAGGGGGGGGATAPAAAPMPVAIPVAVGVVGGAGLSEDAALPGYALAQVPPKEAAALGDSTSSGYASGASQSEDEDEEAAGGAGVGRPSSDAGSDDIPGPFTDPLTFEVLIDPVLTPSGYTFERATILEHIRRSGGTDPFTMQPLREEDLRPNRALREMIEMHHAAITAAAAAAAQQRQPRGGAGGQQQQQEG